MVGEFLNFLFVVEACCSGCFFGCFSTFFLKLSFGGSFLSCEPPLFGVFLWCRKGFLFEAYWCFRLPFGSSNWWLVCRGGVYCALPLGPVHFGVCWCVLISIRRTPYCPYCRVLCDWKLSRRS